MLAGHAAKPPQRVLQTLRQCHIALASKHNMSMLKAGECQPEVIEPMRQHGSSNRDAKLSRIGEVRQAKATGLVYLPKDHIPLRPAKCAPVAYAALQCAPDVCCD